MRLFARTTVEYTIPYPFQAFPSARGCGMGVVLKSYYDEIDLVWTYRLQVRKYISKYFQYLGCYVDDGALPIIFFPLPAVSFWAPSSGEIIIPMSDNVQ